MAIPATPAAAVTKTFQYGNQTITLETGAVARQAASVIVRMGDTVVMVNCVAKKEAKPDQSFFPLTVDYMERFYAGGRIPGGFFKREGRPTEKETLTSRLIDRPLRPLFPDGFLNEVQIAATVMSLDPDINGDIPAMIGASAAVALTGAPFMGPIGAAKVGYKDGHFLLNPTESELKESALELVVAGTRDAVLMVESEAEMLSESVMLGAVLFAHDACREIVKAIVKLAEQAAKDPWELKVGDDQKAVKAELKKLKSMSPMSAEATVSRNYLDWLLSLPWGVKSRTRRDLAVAEQVLDADHYGLERSRSGSSSISRCRRARTS